MDEWFLFHQSEEKNYHMIIKSSFAPPFRIRKLGNFRMVTLFITEINFFTNNKET